MRLLCIFLFTSCLPAQEATYDTVVLGGKIVDGAGNAWFYGDIGIRGERIARITPAGFLQKAPARDRVDARKLVVAPGFIDIQGQSVEQLLTGDGRLISKVTQGITTEILGEGATPAPANDLTVAADDPARAPGSKVEFSGAGGFDEWLRAMEKHGGSVNFGSFVGAATLRVYVKGMAQGPATPAEIAQMRTLARNVMEQGAFGIASALIYPPGSYASTEELIQMAQEIAPYGGVYITHMRSEADHLLEAIDEAIEIGRRGGVPVEIYHLKAAGRKNWDKETQAIAKINAARAAGQDVGADMYAYIAGGTGLTAVLPPWASADGKLLDNLRDPAMRAKIRQEILQQTGAWENMGQLAGAEGVLIVGLDKPENKKFVGKRLSEIAAMQGKDWIDAAMDLILSERTRVEAIYFMMREENLGLQLKQPWIKFGTDADGHDPESAKDLAHPRSYGNYPRLLGKYVREEKVIPIEDAIRKMTSAVATRLSIHDRGLLAEGMYADIVVFDPETIADRATFERPHQLSIGVNHVLVNGKFVVRDGRHTGATPGKLLRGPGAGSTP